MNLRSSLRLMEWPMPPTSADVLCITLSLRGPQVWFRHLLGGILNRADNILIAGAPAEIAGDAPADVLVARTRVLFKQCVGGKQHPRRAESTLQPMLLLKAFLQRMELAVLHEAFHGEDLAAIGLDSKDRARFYRLAIKDYRTSTAIAG